jgi:sulfur-carrier protein
MAIVKFTPSLKRFFPDLAEIELDGTSIAEIVAAANARWDGLADYILDEKGALRKHVNIFLEEELIHDKQNLSDAVHKNSCIYIMQALSGG